MARVTCVPPSYPSHWPATHPTADNIDVVKPSRYLPLDILAEAASRSTPAAENLTGCSIPRGQSGYVFLHGQLQQDTVGILAKSPTVHGAQKDIKKLVEETYKPFLDGSSKGVGKPSSSPSQWPTSSPARPILTRQLAFVRRASQA